MSELVVISFDAEADAGSTLTRLHDVQMAGQLRLEDTAVIAKDQARAEYLRALPDRA